MAFDPLEFLDAPQQQPAADDKPAPAAPEPNSGQVAAPEVQPPASGEAPAAGSEAAAPVAAVSVPGLVPIGAMLDEREKRQALEARLAAIEAERTPVSIPDAATDPAGYQQYQNEQIAFSVLNQRMDMSEGFARMKHGDDLVNTVLPWAQALMAADDQFAMRVYTSPNPYETAITEYNAKQVQDTFGSVPKTEWEEFQAYKAAQKGEAPPAVSPPAPAVQPPAAAKPAPAAPQPAIAAPAPAPKSIADATSAGGTHAVPIGAGQAFDGIFQR